MTPPDDQLLTEQDDSERLSVHSFDGTQSAHTHQQGAGEDPAPTETTLLFGCCCFVVVLSVGFSEL